MLGCLLGVAIDRADRTPRSRHMGRIEGALRIYYLASLSRAHCDYPQGRSYRGTDRHNSGAKAILAAQLNECFSCCSDDYHLFNVQAVVHQGEALPE